MAELRTCGECKHWNQATSKRGMCVYHLLPAWVRCCPDGAGSCLSTFEPGNTIATWCLCFEKKQEAIHG